MAGFAVASQSPPNPSSPSPSDRHSKDIPAPLSLDARPPSSPFPSPSSSFVPPPMPGAHEFANKPPQGRFVRRKKSGSPPNTHEEKGSQKDDRQDIESSAPLSNGNMSLDTAVRPVSVGAAALTPLTPTPASLAKTPTYSATSPTSSSTFPEPEPEPASAPESNGGRDTPTQIQITLPPPPSSPTQIFATSPPTLMRTPSGSGTLSRHTSLSSSRPAPASPASSRRQSGAPSLRSRHRSGLSIASASSSSKFGTVKSAPVVVPPAKRRGEIKIRDFAYPAVDARHTGRGPDTPKVIKRLLKHHGPLTASSSSRRESGMSESSIDSEEGSSRRSSGFGGWGAFRWASKLGGAWGFSTGHGNGSRTSTSGGYTPNQLDLDRNFSDGLDPESAASPAEEGSEEYLSEEYDDEEDDDGGESEELLPGLYRALYDFDPEGTAEMGLKEGQTVRVVGRGGGVGWAIAVRPDGEGKADEGGESNWALVPESYLKVLRLDDAASDADDGPSPDDAREAGEQTG